MAPSILIFQLVLCAEYSFYVKSIDTYAPAFLGYNDSVLARVRGYGTYSKENLFQKNQ